MLPLVAEAGPLRLARSGLKSIFADVGRAVTLPVFRLPASGSVNVKPSSRPARPRHYVEYFCLRMIVAVLQIMPLRWCDALAHRFSWLICDALKFRQKTIRENLGHVFPEMSDREQHQLTRAMWHHLFLMICEIAQASRKIHDTNWRDYVYIRDKKVMTEHFLDWRPVLLIAGHLGNFETALYVTGILGIPTYAVARPLDNPLLDRWLQAFRESRGQFILPTEGSAKDIQRVLDAGALLSMLGDQHAGNKGCWVDFMGRQASCHKAVALFTLSQGVPMIVTYAVRKGGPLHMEIGCNGIADPETLDPGLQDVRSLTQWYNQRLEELIREDPEQYWWMHRRWKEKPARRPRRALPRPAAEDTARPKAA
jgi:KDO2-lipid IV(A) lauroyltransferase